MSAVDITALREGDKVLVRAEVIGPRRIDLSNVERINVSISGHAYGARCSDIVSVELRPLAVGDIVKFGHSEGELRAIDTGTDEAWVRASAGNITVPIRKLVRA